MANSANRHWMLARETALASVWGGDADWLRNVVESYGFLDGAPRMGA